MVKNYGNLVHAVTRSREQDPMLPVKYRAHKDKAGGQPNVVFMLSTCHQPEMELVTPNSDVMKPTAVKSYNKHMGGVDRVDQQLHGLHALRKSYIWYRKLAFRLVLQVILNAHKVFIKETDSNIPFVEFVLENSRQILGL